MARKMIAKMHACRFERLGMGLAVAGGLLFGCGGSPSDDDGASSAGDTAAAPSEPAENADEPTRRFVVDGRGESNKTSSVLEVVEGEGSRLAITGADAADNVIVISVNFEDV